MAFTRPLLSRLISRAKSDIETRLDGSASRLRRTVEIVLAYVVAGAAHGLHGHLVWLSRQLMPDTAEDEIMVRWADIWGLSKVAATKSAGTVDITGSNGSTSPDLTEWQTADGTIYIQQGAQTIAGGGATIDVEADEAGDAGNQTIGTEVSLVTAVAGIDTDATVSGASGLSGGFDEETDASLLARLLSRLQTPPQGGGPGDYEAWALEVSGVTRAWEIANVNGAGTVGLYFVMDNKTDTEIPTASEVATVQAYLDTKAPITATVTAYAPTAVPLNTTIAVVPNTAAVKAAVQLEIDDLVLRLSEADGTTIEVSKISEAISLAEGEQSHVLSSPAVAQVYTVGQIATSGTITWV